MEYALTLTGITKKYADFALDNVTFCVPQGTIVGLVGENGAGKSTLLRIILNLIRKDGGTLTLLGKPEGEIYGAVRGQVGVVFDGGNYPENLSPKRLKKLLRAIYSGWDDAMFDALLERLALPAEKKIRRFSKGMKMKLAIAAAMSHHPRLLILDEPTSGLDPIVRDDILDLLLDFVQNEENSILISSHITSDLEKVADYIVFAHEGRIVFSKPKDELTERYGICKCGAEQFGAIDPEDILAYRRQDYEWQVLVADREALQQKYPKAMIIPATIDEIMLLYVKGEGEKR